MLKQQIVFYKGYFDNIDVMFDIEGTDTISRAISILNTYELKSGTGKKSTHSFDIFYIIGDIGFVALLLYFIYELFVKLFVLK